MIKVYEMKGMNACKMSTEYRGVTINLSFENGNISSKRNARLTTESRFVQEAIEAMPSFGTRIVLAHAVERGVAKPAVAEEERSPRARRQASRGAVTKKPKEDEKVNDDITVVEDVKNLNDAAAYFDGRGVFVESKEQLAKLMTEYGVEFPNMKD